MNDVERILMECRYILSLDKSYADLAKIFNVSIDTINDDLNSKLPKIDKKLYERTKKRINT